MLAEQRGGAEVLDHQQLRELSTFGHAHFKLLKKFDQKQIVYLTMELMWNKKTGYQKLVYKRLG
ncbi:hypothetical protein GCM10025860_26110 [Methanobacterium ferruginis]|nr:hypothetical protein GCM10025860_26110 [Methanobacterium ferruginis]